MMLKFLKFFWQTFSQISSLIFILASLYIWYFYGFNMHLNFSFTWGVLLISAIVSLGSLFFVKNKELSKIQMLVSYVIYFLSMSILAFIFGYYLHWFHIKNISMIICLELIVLAVFAAIIFINYLTDKKTAEEMTKKLRSLQK